MSRRRKRDYKKVLKKIKSLVDSPRVSEFMVDFEAAMWSSLRKVFPDAKVIGCSFHWSQAVWRKIQSLGLAASYYQREGTHMFLRKVFALPLLPAAHIQPAYDDLHVRAKATALILPLMDYIQSTWVDGILTPEDWSVYGHAVRTNNDLERWHRRLNFNVKTAPPFYQSVEELHREAGIIREKKLKKIKRKGTKEMKEKIYEEWD